MIDMSGWASIGVVCDGRDHALTRVEVRALLAEGAECRRDIERRMRAPGAMQTRECGAMPSACGVAVTWPDHWRSR